MARRVARTVPRAKRPYGIALPDVAPATVAASVGLDAGAQVHGVLPHPQRSPFPAGQLAHGVEVQSADVGLGSDVFLSVHARTPALPSGPKRDTTQTSGARKRDPRRKPRTRITCG